MARCWSPVVSRGAAPHSELDDGLGFHSWLPPEAHVSDGWAPFEAPAGATEGLEPPRIQPPVEPLGGCCWAPWPNFWRIKCTSESPGDSAKMVVFPSTQLFRAPWAWNKIQWINGKNWNILQHYWTTSVQSTFSGICTCYTAWTSHTHFHNTLSRDQFSDLFVTGVPLITTCGSSYFMQWPYHWHWKPECTKQGGGENTFYFTVCQPVMLSPTVSNKSSK